MTLKKEYIFKGYNNLKFEIVRSLSNEDMFMAINVLTEIMKYFIYHCVK